MTWRTRTWTRIAAAFMGLMALLLVVGSGLAQELDYTLEELEEKIDKSPWGPKLLLARLDEKLRPRVGLEPYPRLGPSLNPVRTANKFTDSIPKPGSWSPSPSRSSIPRATGRSC